MAETNNPKFMPKGGIGKMTRVGSGSMASPIMPVTSAGKATRNGASSGVRFAPKGGMGKMSRSGK